MQNVGELIDLALVGRYMAGRTGDYFIVGRLEKDDSGVPRMPIVHAYDEKGLTEALNNPNPHTNVGQVCLLPLANILKDSVSDRAVISKESLTKWLRHRVGLPEDFHSSAYKTK